MTSRLQAIDNINRKYHGRGSLVPATQYTSVVASPPIITTPGVGLRGSYVIGGPSTIQQTYVRPSTTYISGGPVINGAHTITSGVLPGNIHPINTVQTHTVGQ
jgi:hypothetical protein